MKLVTIPNKILTNGCEPVEDDFDFFPLLDDMRKIMLKNNGIGLAAPQVGINKRFFIWEDGIAINPVLKPHRIVTRVTASEGCLSVPGGRWPIMRLSEVVLEAQDINRKPFTIQAKGLLARMFQHEVDHLCGVLIHKKKQSRLDINR